MDKLGPTFERRLRQLGIKKQVESANVCREAQRIIDSFFGEGLREDIEIVSFKNGVLKLKAASSTASQEIFMQVSLFKEVLPEIKDVRILS